MVEKIKFADVDHVVEVDVTAKHPSVEFARLAFVEHKPITSVESDDRRTGGEVLKVVGEHFFGCADCFSTAKQKETY